jgi:hypothetical protein
VVIRIHEAFDQCGTAILRLHLDILFQNIGVVDLAILFAVGAK